MPVLRSIRERFARERPLDGLRVAACLHVTAETAILVRTLVAGGAEVALCAANPLSTQDDVAAALGGRWRARSTPRRGEDLDAYVANVAAVVDPGPAITLDDGADLLAFLHAAGAAAEMLGGTEETTTGLVRVRALEAEGRCAARCSPSTRRAPSGSSTTTTAPASRRSTASCARPTCCSPARPSWSLGYGDDRPRHRRRAPAARAPRSIVCEVDPLRALEARMEGFEVMPALEAAARGDVFITVTGAPGVLRREHFARMKDGAVLANAGHFDVEIALDDLRALARRGARGAAAGRAVRRSATGAA